MQRGLLLRRIPGVRLLFLQKADEKEEEERKENFLLCLTRRQELGGTRTLMNLLNLKKVTLVLSCVLELSIEPNTRLEAVLEDSESVSVVLKNSCVNLCCSPWGSRLELSFGCLTQVLPVV